MDMDFLRPLLAHATHLHVIEEDVSPGTLQATVQVLGIPTTGLSLSKRGWSFRTLDDCLAFHGFEG